MKSLFSAHGKSKLFVLKGFSATCSLQTAAIKLQCMEGRKLLKDRKTETATITNNGARQLPLAVICVNKRTRQMSASEASQAPHNLSLLSVCVCASV